MGTHKKKIRTPVPAEIETKVRVEAGYKCSMPRCAVTSGLEIHHIDGNPSNHHPANLLLLCAVCHARVTKKEISRKACEMIKETVQMQGLTPSDLERMESRIVSRIESLVGRQEVATPLLQGGERVKEPDPRIDAAASQVLTFEKANLPLPTGILRALMMSLYHSREFDGALAIVQLLMKAPSLTAADYNNLGVLLNETGRKQEAEEAYWKAIAVDPDDAFAWSNLGLLLDETGRKQEAEEALRKAIAADSLDADFHNNLAYVLLDTGCDAEVEAELHEALRLNPDCPHAYATLGMLFFAKDDLEGGRKGYERAVELSPDDPPLQQKFHYEYGRALARNGETEDARRELQAALEVDSKHIPKELIEAELAKLGDR